jgi:DNA polymerase-3 subunit beta
MATAVAPAPPRSTAAPVELMEFVLDRNQLLAEITIAARASDARSTQPLLTHLLLRARGGGVLSITGTDLQRTVTTECPAAIKMLGEATVHAQKLLSYLKLLPEGKVAMKLLPNQQIQITAGHSRTRMPGLVPTSFPAAPAAGETSIRLSSRGLKTLIRQSLFAVATSSDRYLFNAALLLLRADRMGMVATDGHRLSLVEVQEDGLTIDGYQKILLPRECMGDLLSLLGSSKDESVEFSETDNTMFFRIAHRTLSVRKLVGQFPNYESIIPREEMNSIVLATADFMGYLQRVLQFSDEKSSGVRLQIDKNALTVSACSPGSGESQEALETSYAGDQLTIGFNGHYIAEFLKTIGTEGSVRVALKNGASAAVITPESFHPEYQQKYVVMPMRVG